MYAVSDTISRERLIQIQFCNKQLKHIRASINDPQEDSKNALTTGGTVTLQAITCTKDGFRNLRLRDRGMRKTTIQHGRGLPAALPLSYA